jgi:hypothetical protein
VKERCETTRAVGEAEERGDQRKAKDAENKSKATNVLKKGDSREQQRR